MTAGRARGWCGANFLGIRGMLGILGNRERQGWPPALQLVLVFIVSIVFIAFLEKSSEKS